jgi:hypothetical protein
LLLLVLSSGYYKSIGSATCVKSEVVPAFFFESLNYFGFRVLIAFVISGQKRETLRARGYSEGFGRGKMNKNLCGSAGGKMGGQALPPSLLDHFWFWFVLSVFD